VKFYTQRRSAPVVPLVSLIDILTILLLFFIVTMTFPEKKHALTINLPKSSGLQGASAPEGRLVVAVGADERVLLGDQEVALGDLGAALGRLRAENPDVKLELKADEKLPLGVLVKVWDAFNQAGIAVKDVPARILLQKGGTP